MTESRAFTALSLIASRFANHCDVALSSHHGLWSQVNKGVDGKNVRDNNRFPSLPIIRITMFNPLNLDKPSNILQNLNDLLAPFMFTPCGRPTTLGFLWLFTFRCGNSSALPRSACVAFTPERRAAVCALVMPRGKLNESYTCKLFS